MIEVLRWQLRNAFKLYPVEIAEKDKAEQRTDLINAASLRVWIRHFALTI